MLTFTETRIETNTLEFKQFLHLIEFVDYLHSAGHFEFVSNDNIKVGSDNGKKLLISLVTMGSVFLKPPNLPKASTNSPDFL